MKILFFLAGLVVGGLIGVMVMALMVAARSTDEHSREKHAEH
ncbi:MAG: DUF3789 domain-containing protein [Clostridia bacterium]|nr:DUF3789 domain-containing protein [Clostridia bacterium]